MCADMVFLKDPFPYADTSYDIYGLSDWRRAEVPDPKVWQTLLSIPVLCGVISDTKGTTSVAFTDASP